ncbi:TldD/PmbA family protein [Pelagibaculum spongiae]|uniref:Peptidase n=1 Tax=Pelagibaculum spongiae TaxID=2080658 RepID=A0A2V1GVC3_9GAMM|nr:TldD/PmbA family protein [Pelagibaculum spongiae]PVZ63574.1 peptidase [Pelagibaculum spongiae]
MRLSDIQLSSLASQFVGYTELRVQQNNNTRISMLNGDLVGNSQSSQLGASARSYDKGQWGFASSADLTPDTLSSLIKSAGHNARFLASRSSKAGILLPETQFNCIHDLSTKKPRVSPQHLIEFLQAIDGYIVKACPKIKARQLMLATEDLEKRLLTSTGSDAYTLLPRAMIYVILTAENDQGEPIDLMEPICHGGVQFEDAFTAPELLFPNIDSLYQHLMNKINAVAAEAGRKTVILDSELTGILAHEAVGHTTEADLVLGGSVAGDYLGKQVASELVTMVDLAHSYNGKQLPIPLWIDDEGVEAKDVTLIEKGILKEFMHSRETAAHFGHQLTGNARAFKFSDEPLIRMRNTAILPGQDKLADMISSVEDGYYLMRSNNGQADSTSEFMFGITLGYEIKNGQLGRAINDTTISGVAFDMLKTVSMVSDELHWSCGGYCGKKQSMVVSDAGPALKCEVNIGGQ